MLGTSSLQDIKKVEKEGLPDVQLVSKRKTHVAYQYFSPKLKAKRENSKRESI